MFQVGTILFALSKASVTHARVPRAYRANTFSAMTASPKLVTVKPSAAHSVAGKATSKALMRSSSRRRSNGISCSRLLSSLRHWKVDWDRIRVKKKRRRNYGRTLLMVMMTMWKPGSTSLIVPLTILIIGLVPSLGIAKQRRTRRQKAYRTRRRRRTANEDMFRIPSQVSLKRDGGWNDWRLGKGDDSKYWTCDFDACT